MPFNPSVNNNSGAIWAQGISSLAENYQKFQQNKDDSAALDATLPLVAQQAGMVGYKPDEAVSKVLSGYHDASLSKKRAILGQYTAAIAMHHQQQQQEQAAKVQAAQLKHYAMQNQVAEQGLANDAAFGQAMSQAQGGILKETLAQGNGPVNPRPQTLADFQAHATPAAWQSTHNVNNLLDYYRQTAAHAGQPDFEPSGSMLNIDGINIPVVKTSRGSAQPLEGFARDATGKASGKYRVNDALTPNQELTSIDRELGYFKTMIPGMASPEQIQRRDALLARKDEIMGGHGASPAAASTNAAPAKIVRGKDGKLEWAH